ncbi:MULTISPECIES: IucA/IucC family protein [Pseudomonas]|uniref:IucA/IucC family siderophore biosynthesis protein n=1 Tax=Pseudomonas tritici TaxID=2745518 RepID=A0A8I0CYQ1_9PSED|nr:MULTISPECIES: IucA/IucC family protein [Pseudomonas]MBP2871544.1 IucA/IucC family siderophore biosynthesis protein [Pseudomonas sp. SWRI144]QXH86053.1 IucA/IucC family siderophore biosynthesis protein [Pseudomonas tritici]CRM10253.1 Aerobactin synthase [Pseudomonas sp. 35 E 8]CRM31085.1 Aerobactin synthase [Pseudomonas sp. 24 R 17]CRM59322.1 Aerobactin synthase [Pseudomonas sp. 58 R 12]
MDDLNTLIAYSRKNALRRLIRCLFAENILDRSALAFTPDGRQATYPLKQRGAQLFFSEIALGPADTLVNDGDVVLLTAEGVRQAITRHQDLLDVLRDSFDFEPSDEGVAGLKSDMENSLLNDAHARQYRQHWNARLAQAAQRQGLISLTDYLRRHSSTKDAAILLDQWGSLEGHPYYPTWKARPGLNDSEVEQLSPEFNAQVPLRIAALRADMAKSESMPHVTSYPAWFASNFPAHWEQWKAALNAKGLDETQWLPLPIHGWHLQAYVLKTFAAEIEEGLLITEGPDIQTLPTMSYRTMMPVLDHAAPLIKLPIALWMTSELRSLQAKSIHMGPRISTVITQILEAENGFDQQLEIFPEEIGVRYRHAITQDDVPGKHLSVVFRASRQAFERNDDRLPITVASLFTRLPGSGRPLFTDLIERDGERADAASVERWFRHYAKVVTHPVVAIYLLYGIGLEAHQQNTMVLFSPDGLPRSLLIRDFGDGRTYAPLLEERGYTLQPHVQPGILPTVFTGDIEPVRMFVLDAAFLTHLHEMALWLTKEYGMDNTRLWAVLREETENAFAAVRDRVSPQVWEVERQAFVEDPWPTRSLLRMHLMQYSNYRLQHTLTNPLAAV